eukprot:g1671.t1
MSDYDSLPFAQVVAPLMDRPRGLMAHLDLPIPRRGGPDGAGGTTFNYDFTVEHAAVKEAEEAEISELTEVAARKKRAEEREKERKAAEREREARAAERRTTRAKQAESMRTISQLRQRSVERDREEEEMRKAEAESRRKAMEKTRAARKVSMPERRPTTKEEKQRVAVRQFMTWTGATEEECKHYLTAYDWDLQKAVSNYYGRE